MELQRAASRPPSTDTPALERAAFLSELAMVLLALRPGSRLLVAVDGVDGAGKTTFADELASALRNGGGGASRQVLRVGLDDFHNASRVRYRRGRWSPEGFWQDSYNLEQFREYVLGPLVSGDDRFRVCGHDLATDTVLDPKPVAAAQDAVVLIDGLFLHRDELREYWDFSVFLDVPFEVAAARMAVRDGPAMERSPTDPVDLHPTVKDRREDRYVGGQLQYFAAADPAVQADQVLDNSHKGTLQAISPHDVSYRQGT